MLVRPSSCRRYPHARRALAKLNATKVDPVSSLLLLLPEDPDVALSMLDTARAAAELAADVVGEVVAANDRGGLFAALGVCGSRVVRLVANVASRCLSSARASCVDALGSVLGLATAPFSRLQAAVCGLRAGAAARPLEPPPLPPRAAQFGTFTPRKPRKSTPDVFLAARDTIDRRRDPTNPPYDVAATRAPRKIRAAPAAAPRFVSAESPRGACGGAATRLDGISTSSPWCRRNPSNPLYDVVATPLPRTIHVAPAAAPRPRRGFSAQVQAFKDLMNGGVASSSPAVAAVRLPTPGTGRWAPPPPGPPPADAKRRLFATPTESATPADARAPDTVEIELGDDLPDGAASPER